jgi:hypothetical protein
MLSAFAWSAKHDRLVVRAISEASGRGYRVHYSEPIRVGIFARLVHLTQDVEWPIGQNLDGDPRVLQVAIRKPVSKGVLEIRNGEPLRRDIADQRE